jgi:hypothetical protein
MLPSKKIIGISALCLIVLGGVVYSKVKPGSSLVSSALDLKVVQSTSTPTNLHLLQSKVASSNQSTTNANFEEPSLTQAISQDFASEYVNLQATGNDSLQNKAALITNLSQRYATSTKITLSLRDISTFPDGDTVKARAFGNTASHIILNHYKTLKVSPLDLISEAQQTKDPSITLKLQKIANAYRTIGLELQKTPAPASFAPFYLQIINGYLSLADDVEYMSAYYADPVKSFIGINNYQNELFVQADLLKNFPIYFEANGILFSNEEDGILWSSF